MKTKTKVILFAAAYFLGAFMACCPTSILVWAIGLAIKDPANGFSGVILSVASAHVFWSLVGFLIPSIFGFRALHNLSLRGVIITGIVMGILADGASFLIDWVTHPVFAPIVQSAEQQDYIDNEIGFFGGAIAGLFCIGFYLIKQRSKR